MGFFHRVIERRLARHINELEKFELEHLSALPKGWSRVKPIIKSLRKIDEKSIKDLIKLHKENKKYKKVYPKVMPLLFYLHRDLERMLKVPNLDEQKKEIRILRGLIAEIKEIIGKDEWKDEDFIAKIGSSELIYRKDEPVQLAMARYFVLADQFKKALSDYTGIPKAWHYVLPLSRDQFIKLYMQVYRKIGLLKPSKVIELVSILENIEDATKRKEIVENAKWRVEIVKVKDMGIWPHYGGVDYYTTNGNLPDTVKKIKEIIHGNIIEWPATPKPKLPDKVINSIYSMRHYADLIYRLFPIVLLRSGKVTRRVYYNLKTTRKFGFETTITKYDIEDGSHRAVALASIGVKQFKCFVGRGLQKY